MGGVALLWLGKLNEQPDYLRRGVEFPAFLSYAVGKVLD